MTEPVGKNEGTRPSGVSAEDRQNWRDSAAARITAAAVSVTFIASALALRAAGVALLVAYGVVSIGLLVAATALAYREYGWHKRTSRLVGLVLGLVIVAVVVTLPFIHKQGSPAAGANGLTSGSPSPSPSSTPIQATPTPMTGIAVPPPNSCGPIAQVSNPLPAIDICVYYWCRGNVLNLDGSPNKKQAQIKIRPRITNNSDLTLSIAITKPSAIRLIVTDPGLPQAWSPPPATTKAGDRPIAVSYHGTQSWALPPNVPHDAQMTKIGIYNGFATFWSPSTLAPGASYFEPLTHKSNGDPVQVGDLVFQVPSGASIVGIVVMTQTATAAILGDQPRVQWPASSDPGSF